MIIASGSVVGDIRDSDCDETSRTQERRDNLSE